MSYLKESRCVKVLTRNTINAAMSTYIDLSLPINEDSTCRYDRLNTTAPATTLWVEYQYKNLSGFCQMMPSCAPTQSSSSLAFNYFNTNRKNPNTGYNPIDTASALKHYNKAVNTSGQKANLIGFKSFSLSQDVKYMLYDRNVGGSLTNDQILTDGALFILPIGDNR